MLKQILVINFWFWTERFFKSNDIVYRYLIFSVVLFCSVFSFKYRYILYASGTGTVPTVYSVYIFSVRKKIDVLQEPYDYVIKRVIALEGDTVRSHVHPPVRVRIPEG